MVSRLLYLLLTILSLGSPRVSARDWWENAQLYQIYPRSYYDTNSDGIGDLKGVTLKLDHLKDAGITAAWLSPIFLSPMVDFGYDIADFRAIQPEYGTMEDFQTLTKKARELGIKIILDFVPNHSSDKHEWFEKSARREDGYDDYYLWDDGVPDPQNASKRIPSNNWNSMFRGSAWTWNEVRGQFYFHQFEYRQPDLNFRNPKVVEDMKDVLRFWLDQGADGFRVDALPHLFETDRLRHGDKYPDEPESEWNHDLDDYGSLNHIYTRDQPENFDMVMQWRKTLDDYSKEHDNITRVMMTEAYSDIDLIMKYFGNGTHVGAHFPFNFNFITDINRFSRAQDIEKAIHKFVDVLPNKYVGSNWVIGNHDNGRVASRYGQERVNGLQMLVMLLPGIGVTYQGDELGMEDQWLTWEETVDPQACNTNSEVYASHSRDPERTPFQWDDTKNAGFSTANMTWLPVAKNYKTLNLKAQQKAKKSNYKVYQTISRLRRKPAFADGTLTTKSLSDSVLSFKREVVPAVKGVAKYAVVLNLGSESQFVDVSALGGLRARLMVVAANIASSYRVGDMVIAKKLKLAAYDSLVLSS